MLLITKIIPVEEISLILVVNWMRKVEIMNKNFLFAEFPTK